MLQYASLYDIVLLCLKLLLDSQIMHGLMAK